MDRDVQNSDDDDDDDYGERDGDYGNDKNEDGDNVGDDDQVIDYHNYTVYGRWRK